MGIRHKEYVMEVVQFHPESIASEDGFLMFSNFLKLEDGKWSELHILEVLIYPVYKLGYSSQKGITSGHILKDDRIMDEGRFSIYWWCNNIVGTW